MDRLNKELFNEVTDYKNSFSEPRYRWLLSLTKNFTISKALVALGYVMAVADAGKNTGNIISILQDIVRIGGC